MSGTERDKVSRKASREKTRGGGGRRAGPPEDAAAAANPAVVGPHKTGRRLVAQTGRKLGPRALLTRQRLLEATAELLRERSVLDLSVVEIARRVGSSPATFYHYFKDVEEAALALAEQAAEEMPAVLELIDGSWRGQRGLETARAIVDAFMAHWDVHHEVLLVRNLSADKGDRRFQRVRRAALKPVLDHLAARIAEAQQAGRVAPEMHPYAAAAALASALERLSAHYKELEVFGVTRENLSETCARLIHQVITGRTPR